MSMATRWKCSTTLPPSALMGDDEQHVDAARAGSDVLQRKEVGLSSQTGGDVMAVVLVVEDHEDTLDLIGEVLKRLNYQIRTATTAAAALDSARQERPDAILLDIKLPDASGTIGLDQLRKLRPTVPVIMLTANTDGAVARDTLKHGAFDYITKPFDVQRLKSVLEAALAL
jgi:DNA-binding NtrC family response regulator